MRMLYRQGDREHGYVCDTDAGSILAVVARRLPREVGIICHNGTASRPKQTTRDDLVAATMAVLAHVASDPELLFRYRVQTDASSPYGVAGSSVGMGGIRFEDTPADRAYGIDCGPGHCDLKEFAVGSDGRGTLVGMTDLRSRSDVVTASWGTITIHRRPAKTDLVRNLNDLLRVVEKWPLAPIDKVMGTHTRAR